MTPANHRTLRHCARLLAIVTVVALLGGCGFAQSFCGTDPANCDVQSEFN